MKLIKNKDIDKLSLNEVKKLYKEFVSSAQVSALETFDFGDEIVNKAIGQWIYTNNGKKILDYTGGYGVLNHGHNHPKILKTRINFQENNRMEVHKNYLSQYLAALSHNIASLLPQDLNKIYLPNSGAEANEGAIKLAYKYFNGRKKYLLHSDISFHGKLLGTGSISNSPESNFQFPGLENTDQFNFNDINSLKQKISKYKDNIFCIIIEPYSASNLLSISNEFIQELRKICETENIILIFDEVYSGWAKTGKLFYFMYFENIIPDILTFSKSFGGGKSSISGYACRDKFYEKAYNNIDNFNLHSTTYNAFGEEAVTAIEAINIIIEDEYCQKAKDIEKKTFKKLNDLKIKYPSIINDVRGVGALMGIKLKNNINIFEKFRNLLPFKILSKRIIERIYLASIIKHMYEQHNILLTFTMNKEQCLLIAPCLIIKDEDIENLSSSLDKTFKLGLNKLVLNLINTRIFNLFRN